MMDHALLDRVFIPDLLVPIVKYLGEDNVAIRFVCKQVHASLVSVSSGMRTRPLTPLDDVEMEGVHWTSSKEYDAVSMDRFNRNKAKPYVTSISRLSWAIEALEMPMRDCTYYAAVESGTIAVVSWLKDNALGGLAGKFPWDNHVTAAAAKYGNLSVLKWLRAQSPPCPWGKYVCSDAAESGQLAVLQWLRAQDPPCPWDSYVCDNAALNGHLVVLQWLRAQDPPCPWDAHVCKNAAMNGHLAVLQWARAQNPPCPWSYWVSVLAVQKGRLEVLQWLRAQKPPCPWDENVCWSAARIGHLELLQWARAQNPPCPWDVQECLNVAITEEMRVWIGNQMLPRIPLN